MATLTVQTVPQGVGIAPTYQPVSAADKFAATPGAEYLLHYKNGATAEASTSANVVVDQTSVAPAGSSPAAGWADLLVSGSTGLAASSEACVLIQANRFIDANGFINIKAGTGATLTTVTVAILQV